MKTIFQVAIGHDEEAGNYSALAQCMEDGRVQRTDSPNLRKLMGLLREELCKKRKQLKDFPLPEPSPIITPNGNGDTPRIVALHGPG